MRLAILPIVRVVRVVIIPYPRRSLVVTKSNKSPQALAKSPIFWGAIVCCGFYGLFFVGVLDNEFVDRYFASHPVEYVATIMFFIGLAALAIKGIDIAAQHQGLAKPLLGPIPLGGQPVIDCEPLAGQLKRLPQRVLRNSSAVKERWRHSKRPL